MTTTELVSVEVLVSPARVAVSGFLTGYSGRKCVGGDGLLH